MVSQSLHATYEWISKQAAWQQARTACTRSLMHTCVDLVAWIKSINPISSPLSSKCNIWSIYLDCFTHTGVKVTCSPVLGFCDHTSIRPWSIPPCLSGWLQADICRMAHPLFQLILCYLSSRCWFISSHLSAPHPAIILSLHTAVTSVVTELGRWWSCGAVVGVGRGGGSLRRKWWALCLS